MNIGIPNFARSWKFLILGLFRWKDGSRFRYRKSTTGYIILGTSQAHMEKVTRAIPIKYQSPIKFFVNVTICVIELKFKIYYDFGCGNTWVLWMDITSVGYVDIIMYHLSYVR